MDKKESMSNWSCVVTELLEKEKSPISLGRYGAYWFHRTPRRMLHCLSYYKFAAKMIGSQKKVLDVGCNEGLGSWLLAKECGFCKGIDFDKEAIDSAKRNFSEESISFSCEDFLQHSEQESFDSVVNFDVVEHIYPEHAPVFFQKMSSVLHENGMAIVGTPSEISQKFASEVSKKGHVNIYSAERLEEEMSRVFEFVFLFAVHDEIVHTGYLPLAHYLIAMGVKPKKNV